jgi:hypothetical protein
MYGLCGRAEAGTASRPESIRPLPGFDEVSPKNRGMHGVGYATEIGFKEVAPMRPESPCDTTPLLAGSLESSVSKPAITPAIPSAISSAASWPGRRYLRSMDSQRSGVFSSTVHPRTCSTQSSTGITVGTRSRWRALTTRPRMKSPAFRMVWSDRIAPSITG